MISPGYRFLWKGGQMQVLAIAEGYAMCRRPWRRPLVLLLEDVERCAAVPADAKEEW